MTKRFLLLAALIWLVAWPALAQIPTTGAGTGAPSGGGGCTAGTFGIDPNAGANPTTINSSSLSSLTITVSTTKCPDEIMVAVTSLSTINSVTSPHLTFTERGTIFNNTGEWVATASGALTSEVITVAVSVAAFTTVGAVAETGIHSAAPFDPNAAIPSISANCTWTTTNANDLLLAISNSSATPVAAATWTQVMDTASSFIGAAQKIVAATQTSLGSTTAFSSGDDGYICDALIQGP